MQFWKLIFLCLIVFLGIIPVFKQAMAAPTTDTLEGYWKFDQISQGSVALDSGGSLRNATPFGSDGGPNPTTTTATTSFPNPRALDFNGTDQYLEVADYEDFDDSTYTISFWARFDNINSTHQTLVAKWHVGVRQQFTVQLTNGNRIGFWTGDGAGGSSGALLSDFAPTEDVWYHVTAVASGTDKALYINGIDNKYTGTGTLTGDADIELTFGSKKNFGGTYFEFFDGQLDDIRYYSRALSDLEIDALAAGNHTRAAWGGSVSNEFEEAGNWNINAIPDPYTHVDIAGVGHQPVIITEDIALASLTIGAGASFDANCFEVSYNDGGGLTNNGEYIDCSSSTPTSNSGNLNARVNNAMPKNCGDEKPASVPDLFQIDVNNTQAILYFTPSYNSDKYFISYGDGNSTNQYGVEFRAPYSDGVIKYTINHLSPNSSYSFGVRGGNGCMPGDWSNTMTIKTTNSESSAMSYYKSFLSKILSMFPN